MLTYNCEFIKRKHKINWNIFVENVLQKSGYLLKYKHQTEYID